MASTNDLEPAISPTDVIDALLKGWRILLISVAVALLVAVVSLHRATYEYTAQLTIYPTEPASQTGSQLGGLASLAGINVSKNATSPFEIYSEELYSRDLADSLSKDQGLMRQVFVLDWDAKSSTWREPVGLLTGVKTAIKGVLGFPVYPWRPPGGAELQEYIVGTVHYDEVPRKSAVTLSYDNKDPKFATEFLDKVHREADERVRQATLQKLTKYIAYLNEKIQTGITQENKLALINVLSDQEKLSMTASSNVAFSAESVGNASVPARPGKPSPPRMMVTYAFAGLVIGMGIILCGLFMGDGGFRSALTFLQRRLGGP